MSNVNISHADFMNDPLESLIYFKSKAFQVFDIALTCSGKKSEYDLICNTVTLKRKIYMKTISFSQSIHAPFLTLVIKLSFLFIPYVFLELYTHALIK